MNKITEVTRRDIFSLFKHGMTKSKTEFIYNPYYGKLEEIEFLKRLYDLKKLPSSNRRFPNAEREIFQHTVFNDDYMYGWVFEDERFELLNGDDKILLDFLCAVFNPNIRVENSNWKEFLGAINELLRKNGYELYPKEIFLENDVYEWREFNLESSTIFYPYSKRNETIIKSKQIMLKLNKKIRFEIYSLLEKKSLFCREYTEKVLEDGITIEESVFQDISRYYKPKCYDDNDKYVETNDMKQFIMNTSPFCILDAIELYAKYANNNSFTIQINELFKRNAVAFKLEQGKFEFVCDISIKKEDILKIPEQGLRELIGEANDFYRNGNIKIAVEKIWDALERLKTYYGPALDKKHSSNKIIEQMSNENESFSSMINEEFATLTKIGNKFRIRHHEIDKIDITDKRHYEYFYKRCLSLISTAIQYLDGRKD